MPRVSKLDPDYINRAAELPHGLTLEEVENAVSETYRLFHGVNDFLTSNGFRPLQQLLLGNSLSGIISEFLVKNLVRESASLEANTRVGGHPDLLPTGYYSTNSVLKGDRGIEVKASINQGGWQGHNPEESWVMVFRYRAGKGDTAEDSGIEFIEILGAHLAREDWSANSQTKCNRA